MIFLRAQRSSTTAVIPILSKIVESSLRLVIFFIDEKRVIIFNFKKNHFELSCLFMCSFFQRKCDGTTASPSKLDAFEVKRGTVKFFNELKLCGH